jgi:hypothetical protein
VQASGLQLVGGASLFHLDGDAGLTLLWWWGRGSAGACWWHCGGASGGFSGFFPVECRGCGEVMSSVIGGEGATGVVFRVKASLSVVMVEALLERHTPC